MDEYHFSFETLESDCSKLMGYFREDKHKIPDEMKAALGHVCGSVGHIRQMAQSLEVLLESVRKS